uniref:Small ribosomal subunit protein uS4c n=1 Tax=Pinus thunbergii TaxID=3350 RepID=RR4_PINTH|nr:ribosomal protein S4 [Pinus thunbergii]P41638.1 RecName: Full=Small ribosomal subunit protein uS4c; AltName: Full=30S ribosomal protein S4, chloroplastic [Pinus thunbergii]BAA04412.1 ribosomal protein S4 [Pinus thunbergii]
MSRYRGPRLKIIRRLKTLPGLTSKRPKNRKDSMNRSSSRKISQYRIRLEEKQKLRFHYGLTERQLLKYVRIARRAKGSRVRSIAITEMRLDKSFSIGYGSTSGARQLVNHGHIRVNDHMVDIPSYPCKPQDVITIRDQQRLRAIIKKNIDLFQRDKLPNHLTFHSLQYKGFINQIIDSKWINLKINELLVVEYYSRQA